MIEKKNMNLRKRLMYQCTHMGTKELDLLLGEFAKKKLKNLLIGKVLLWSKIYLIKKKFSK